jgi:hypothetical protein
VAAAATGSVARLKAFGAADIFVVAAAPGVGDEPECDVVFTGAVAANSIMEGIRNFERSITEPSDDLKAELDSFDPDRIAWVMGGMFDTGTRLFDRRLYGARRKEWAALEDKIAIVDVFAQAGIPTAPQVVVPTCDAVAASREVETPLGSVWAADNREGWHGGAEGTRWVGATDQQRAAAVEWATSIADRVRIMPFLDGVPCSIHGFRTDTGLAVFRPIEMNTFLSSSTGFRYGGLASTWEPPESLRTAMRDAARAVGTVLHDRIGYLGGFSIDGVATRDGFLPTEVNPRLSPGLGMQAFVVDRLDLGWVTRMLAEGDISIDHRWLESEILTAADTIRSGRLTLSLFEPLQPAEVRIRFDGGVAMVADEDNACATLSVGPGPAGPVVFMRFDAEAQPFGERFAPYALAAARLAAELWGFELEELEIAPDRHPED